MSAFGFNRGYYCYLLRGKTSAFPNASKKMGLLYSELEPIAFVRCKINFNYTLNPKLQCLLKTICFTPKLIPT